MSFKSSLFSFLAHRRTLQCSLAALLAEGNANVTRTQAEHMVADLEDRNLVMLRDGVIHKI